MSFNKLFLENFRRFSAAEFSFAETGITLISGQNGAGKSTLLEGVHMLCMGRSSRDVRLPALVCQTAASGPAAYFRIEGVQEDGTVRSVAYLSGQGSPAPNAPESGNPRTGFPPVRIGGGPILFKEGGRACRRTDWIGRPAVVQFCPEEMNLITGGPENRRRFMDRILSQENPEYLFRLRRYIRTLEERNALLKNLLPASPEALLAVDETLAQDADPLVTDRRKFNDAIRADLPDKLAILGAPHLASRIRPEPVETSKNDLLSALIAARSQDFAARHTTVGPHRDDLKFMDGNLPAASTLSQGETRILTVALKLLEVDRLTRPVLLFDDLFSELDDTRRDAVSNFLLEYPGQVLMTTCLPPHPDLAAHLKQSIEIGDTESILVTPAKAGIQQEF